MMVDGSKTLQWTQDDTKTADSVELVEMVLPKGDNVDGLRFNSPALSLSSGRPRSSGFRTYVGKPRSRGVHRG